jgi:hypothetical protein
MIRNLEKPTNSREAETKVYPMAEKKSWTYILMKLPEQYLEFVSVFKEASRHFPFIFLFEKADKSF